MAGQTVLLVEDDEDSRRIYGTMLRHSGYTTLEAASALEALELIASHRPVLIVLDIDLPPGPDGWSVVSLMRTHPETASIPVVILTANDREHGERARELGLEHFCKPLSPIDLVDCVARIIGPAQDVSAQ